MPQITREGRRAPSRPLVSWARCMLPASSPQGPTGGAAHQTPLRIILAYGFPSASSFEPLSSHAGLGPPPCPLTWPLPGSGIPEAALLLRSEADSLLLFLRGPSLPFLPGEMPGFP